MNWTHLKLNTSNGYFADFDTELYLNQDGSWSLDFFEKPGFGLPADKRLDGELTRKEQKRLQELLNLLLKKPAGKPNIEFGSDGPSYELLVYTEDQRVQGWGFYWSLGFSEWDAAFKELHEMLVGRWIDSL